MDNALAITGFYFTLIGFISGLFFTRLDGWYGSVREFEGELNVLVSMKANREKFDAERVKMKGLLSSRPFGSFVAVGLLMTFLLFLSLFVERPVSTDRLVFLTLPLVLTVLAYWLGGRILLLKGKKILEIADDTISKARSG